MLGAAVLVALASIAFLYWPGAVIVGIVVVRPSVELWADGALMTIGGLKVSLSTLITLFLVAVGLPYVAQRWSRASTAPAMRPFVAVGVVALASVLVTPSFAFGLTEWLLLASIAVTYALVYLLNDSRRQVMLTLAAAVVGAVPAVLVGLHQMMTIGPGAPLGRFQFVRADGGFPEPDAYGIFLAFSIIAGVLILLTRGLRWRIPVALALAFALAALVGSYTRTAWIALVVGLLVIGALRHRSLLLLLPIAAVVVVTAVPSTTTRFSDLAQSSSPTTQPNTLDARIALWRQAATKVSHAPVLGHGLGSIGAEREQLVHNDFLRMAIETGMIGFAAFVALLVAALSGCAKALRHARRNRDPLLITAAVGGLAVSSMYVLASIPANLVTKVALAGLAWTLVATAHAAGRLASVSQTAAVARGKPTLPAAQRRREQRLGGGTPASGEPVVWVASPSLEPSATDPPPLRTAADLPSSQPTSESLAANSKGAGKVDDENHRSDLVRLARGGALNIAGGIANGVLGFAFAILIARGVGVAEAGVFFQVVALQSIVSTVAQLGATSGLVRMISRDIALGRAGDIRATLRVGLIPVVAVGACLAIAIIVSAPWAAGVIASSGVHSFAVVSLAVIAPFIFIDAVLGTILRACQGFGSMLPIVAVYNVGVPATRLALGVAVVVAGGPAVGLLFAWTVPLLVGLVIAVPWLLALVRRAETARDEARRGTREIARDFWSYTSYQAFAAVVQIILLRLDVLLLGALRTPGEAAVYATASLYLTAGTMILNAIVFVIGPQVSGMLARGHNERARVVYQIATLWVAALAFPVFIALAVFSPAFMGIFGPAFVVGSTTLTILALAMLVNIGTGAVRAVLSMGGKSSWLLFDNSIALALNVILNLALIPKMGMEGAAIAWAAAIAAGNLVPLIQVWRLWRLQPVTSEAVRVVACAAVCYGATGLALRAGLGATGQALIASLVTGSVVYGAVIWKRRGHLQAGIVREALQIRRRPPP